MDNYASDDSFTREFNFQAQTLNINDSNMYDIAGNMIVNNVELNREELKALLAGTINEEQERRFNQLNRVVEAPYNSVARESASGCMEGTRTDVLQKIQEWISSDDTLLFWLNGMAGTGKSAIAHSTAMECHASGLLGASFFFSRDQQARRETRYLFQTIAFQLGNAFPALKTMIADVLKDQTILTSNLRTQLRELILNPISNLHYLSSYSIVIVLDALDECEDENAVIEIIDLLVKEMTQQQYHLKFFVTSRPERVLRRKFESLATRHSAQQFILHEVNPSDVDSDIHLFIRHELNRIANNNVMENSGAQWPREADVSELAKVSGGLFVAASTATRFVSPIRGSLDPRHRLRILLDFYTKRVRTTNLAFDHLDRMYTNIIIRATHGGNPDMQELFRKILSMIVLSYARFTIKALSGLLQINTENVISMLEELRSVILVPEESSDTVHAFHQSFHDYLIDKARCTDTRFYIDAPVFHAEIGRLCLEKLSAVLKRDMCNIRHPWKMNSEVEDLQERMVDIFSLDIRYACKYWLQHLSECVLDDLLLDVMTQFALEKILFWVEALSLLGELGNGIASLRKARLKLSLMDMPRHLLEVLRDTELFMVEFYYVINKSALHIYYSALPFTPINSLLYRAYTSETTAGPRLIRGFKTEWDSCLLKIDTFSPHSNVSISHSGTMIASSIHVQNSGVIRIWDIHTGTQICKLDAPRVLSVAFSHDDKCLVTGSSDGIVRLWDTNTGIALIELEGHTLWVVSVAISPDGTRVVSGSLDNTVRIWDVDAQVELHKLEGHSDCVNCVAVSKDGSRIVSGSEDKTICIWDTFLGAKLHKLEAQASSVLSVVILHDGVRIVFGSSDKFIRIWDSESGAILTELKGHVGRVKSLAVSYDGNLLISGSDDSKICIWDTRNGANIRTLEGHKNCVHSVAISRDGTRIVSASTDRTIRIWEITAWHRVDVASRLWDRFTRILSRNNIEPNESHSSAVSVIAFSHNGRRVVSGSTDSSIYTWNTQNGVRLRKLKGHFGAVRSFDFSDDDTRIISYADDMTIRIWHTFTGTALHTIFTDGNCVDIRFHPAQDRVIANYTYGMTKDLRDVVVISTSRYKIPLFARPLSVGETILVQEDSEIDRCRFRNDWVIRNEKEILCIPVAYRGVHTFSKSYLALGTRLGEVVIVHIPQDSPPI